MDTRLKQVLLKCQPDNQTDQNAFLSQYDDRDKRFSGDLHCFALTEDELSVLNPIKYIQGDLIISSEKIEQISTFNHLQVLHNLQIMKMSSLQLITGFNSLERLHSLNINNNPYLKGVYGFNRLFHKRPVMQGSIKITHNKLLKSVAFLSGVERVKSSLYLHYNQLNNL